MRAFICLCRGDACTGIERRNLTAESTEDPEYLKRKFCEICYPQQYKTMERHKFHSRNQKQAETIEVFISDLRNKAKRCNFGKITDELICDRLVCGINSENS